MYRQTTISDSTRSATKMVVRTPEIIAMGMILHKSGDVGVALQDAFTVVVSTEVVVKVVRTKIVASLFVF